MLRLPTLAVFAALTSTLLGSASYAEEKSIVVASTTSTQDSGLFSHILPLFKTKTGIDVMVLAQGTGQARWNSLFSPHRSHPMSAPSRAHTDRAAVRQD